MDVGKTKNDVKIEDLEIEPDNEPLQIFHLSATAFDFPVCSTSAGNYDECIISYFSNLIYGDYGASLTWCFMKLQELREQHMYWYVND